MALIAGRRRIHEIANSLVITRHARLIAVLVARNATEIRVIRLVDMAICARRPNTLMVRSRIDWEPGMVERRSRPCGRRVAQGAVCWEAGSAVVWIRRAGVIGLMAPVAVGRQRRVVIADVTQSARHRGVRAG